MTDRTAYLLCFIDPATGQPARYRHAGHYLGDTEEGREAERLAEHRAGVGAVLTAAARRAGLDFIITRTWPGGADKARQLKSQSGASYCPDCSDHPLPGTRPRRPGAKYLTRRQREAREADRRAREAMEKACRQAGAYAYPWPGQPLPACPGCEDPGAPHTAECDERERAVARFLQQIGAEPREETGQMFGRERRADARDQAQQEARAQDEADRLFAEADRLDGDGQPGGYRQQITADRAARMMRQLGEPGTRDAASAGPGLAGEDLDAEIARLAAMFPEPLAGSVLDEAVDRAEQGRQAERRAAGAVQAALQAGDGQPGGPARERLQAARQSRLDAEAGAYAAATRLQQEALGDAGPDAPDHLYGSPECGEADPETAHFGWSAAEPEDAGRFPLPRVLDAREASPVLAPVAAGLPDGTPHADPFLAGRGWQAQGGVYQRTGAAQHEREAG